MKLDEKNKYLYEALAGSLKSNKIVNLGIGIPCKLPRYVNDKSILFHSETGVIDYELESNYKYDNSWSIDSDYIDATGNIIKTNNRTVITDISETFSIMRNGYIDVSVLGAYQIDSNGRLAGLARNYETMRGFGGAMDLMQGAKKIYAAMMHTSSSGHPKVVKKLSMPQTAERSIDKIFTDRAQFTISDGGLILTDIAPGYSLSDIKNSTEADFTLASGVK